MFYLFALSYSIIQHLLINAAIFIKFHLPPLLRELQLFWSKDIKHYYCSYNDNKSK